MFRFIVLAASIAAASAVAWATEIDADPRVHGLARIQAATQFCEFSVSTEALVAYLEAQELNTLEALNAVQAYAFGFGAGIKDRDGETTMMCAQAKATADAIGILAE